MPKGPGSQDMFAAPDCYCFKGCRKCPQVARVYISMVRVIRWVLYGVFLLRYQGGTGVCLWRRPSEISVIEMMRGLQVASRWVDYLIKEDGHRACHRAPWTPLYIKYLI